MRPVQIRAPRLRKAPLTAGLSCCRASLARWAWGGRIRACRGPAQSRSHLRRFARCTFSRATRLSRPAFCIASLRRAISFLTPATAASDVDRPGPGLFNSTIRAHSSTAPLRNEPRENAGARHSAVELQRSSLRPAWLPLLLVLLLPGSTGDVPRTSPHLSCGLRRSPLGSEVDRNPTSEGTRSLVSEPGPAGTSRSPRWPRLLRGCPA